MIKTIGENETSFFGKNNVEMIIESNLMNIQYVTYCSTTLKSHLELFFLISKHTLKF